MIRRILVRWRASQRMLINFVASKLIREVLDAYDSG